jgi:hypothetical protein
MMIRRQRLRVERRRGRCQRTGIGGDHAQQSQPILILAVSRSSPIMSEPQLSRIARLRHAGRPADNWLCVVSKRSVVLIIGHVHAVATRTDGKPGGRVAGGRRSDRGRADHAAAPLALSISPLTIV